MIKQLENGRYRLLLNLTAGRLCRTFDTKKQAVQAEAEARSRAHRGDVGFLRKAPLFEKAAEAWYLSKANRRPTTCENWRRHIDRHLTPALVGYRLDRISAATIEKLRLDLGAKLAPRAVRSLIGTVSGIFKYARRHGLVTHNPVADAERVYTPSAEIAADEAREPRGDGEVVQPDQVLNSDEIRRLLEHTRPGGCRTLFTLAAATGARSGELLGLRWSDVQFDDGKGRGRVFIRQTLAWSGGKARFYPPKTRAGVRSIPIPHHVVVALKTWRLACPRSDIDLVFPTATGRPAMRANILRLGLQPALRRAGLRHVTMHSLRHSYASALIQHGAPLTEITALLGHASPAITLRVYAHFLQGTESGATERVADALFGNRDQSMINSDAANG